MGHIEDHDSMQRDRTNMLTGRCIHYCIDVSFFSYKRFDIEYNIFQQGKKNHNYVLYRLESTALTINVLHVYYLGVIDGFCFFALPWIANKKRRLKCWTLWFEKFRNMMLDLISGPLILRKNGSLFNTINL